jgi:hypothetical protein
MNRVFAWPVGQGQFSLPARYSAVYAIGSITGGAALGAGLAGMTLVTNMLPSPAVRVFVSLLAFAAVSLELTGRMGFLPQRSKQVPREWLVRAPSWYSFAFGLSLGSAVITHLYHAVAYGILAALLASGHPALGLWVGIAFGIARGIVPLLFRVFATSESRAASVERAILRPGFELASRLTLFALGVMLLSSVLLLKVS